MFTEDLDLFFADFGVPVSAGGLSGVGILDMPTQVISDGMVLSTEYSLTVKAADFGGLLCGDGITVDGVSYQVRDLRRIDDGRMCVIAMSRLSPLVTAPGGQPREFALSDLADVQIRNPQNGDRLVYDGEKWVDMEDADETNVIDGGRALM